MRQSEEFVSRGSSRSTWNGVERRRVEKVVETLATSRSRGENLSEVAHDARNMVTALVLYCDLLEEPGVLATAFTHYAHELRLVAAASRRLVEKLVTLDANASPEGSARILLQASAGRGISLASDSVTSAAATSTDMSADMSADMRAGGNAAVPLHAGSGRGQAGKAIAEGRIRHWEPLPALPISNLAAELLANRNLLSALAGPSIALTMEAVGGTQAVRLSGEDLTRLLVNLLKNAAEAMPKAQIQNKGQNCCIHISLRERETAPGAVTCLALTVEDNGPGIAEAALDSIFTSGFTSRGKEAETGGEAATRGGWPQSHRGLGLAIVRSIVEGAGGRITASNRTLGGACFTLELPVRKVGYEQPANS